MSRYAIGKTTVANNRPKVSVSFHQQPVPTINNRPKVALPASGIVGKVRKVAAEVSELQKKLAVESAARGELHKCVEELKIQTTEAKEHFVNGSDKLNNKRRSKGTLTTLMRTMPCKNIPELDWLLKYIESRSSQWVEYIKMLGGRDCSTAIKNIFDTIMEKGLLKQLSWTGRNTTKPSLKNKYKEILTGIHVALKEAYKDYTIDFGEQVIHKILKNAN